ncbi:MAG TPA: cyclic nucleotide-binding domain-containing protein [Actinomycetota bacterium]|jgi:CRP-like cAMP-binding protein
MIARESEAMAKREQEALARVPLFSGLSSRHLKRLADSMQEVRYMEGASVVKKGQEGDSFYVILQGEATVIGPGGTTVNRLQPGDFFGEISLLDGGARTATVTTETPMTMLELKRMEFMRMVEDEPDVAVKLLSHTASLLRRAERSLAG